MNRIYYFSSTGNTLAAARKFAEKIGDAELVSIADMDRSEQVDFSGADTVGVFSPVYCFGLPQIVWKFAKRIKKMDDSEKKPFCYAFFTCGGMKGSARFILQELMLERGFKLSNAFAVKMPSNYIAFFNPPSESRMKKIFDKADQMIDAAVADVLARKEPEVVRVFPFDALSDLVAKRATAMLHDYDKYFWVSDACDACGLCEKICPESNIIIQNGMPTWHSHCIQCMACVQWCPKEAIQFKKATLKRKRYHHPDVKVDDLILKICK